jgi:hypothetical protein
MSQHRRPGLIDPAGRPIVAGVPEVLPFSATGVPPIELPVVDAKFLQETIARGPDGEIRIVAMLDIGGDAVALGLPIADAARLAGGVTKALAHLALKGHPSPATGAAGDQSAPEAGQGR